MIQRIAVVVLFGMLFASVGWGAEARLLRFADIHEDRIAFVYAGDIWTVAAQGGVADRLTTDEGLELFPKFSPDGRWIAYSAEYGGNRQIYVISVDGGEPRQLTFYNDVGPLPPRGGFDYRVLDWTPDGKHVLFRANRLPWGVRMGRPYLVPFEGGMERPLPVPEGGAGMFSPDGRKLVYTPIDREFRTWKRYRGGRAQDVWIFDLDKLEAEQLTDFEGTDNQPVWVGDKIYFTSDRDRRLNLYSINAASRGNTESRSVEQVTRHEDFDVLWPSAGPRQIVYECGGYLYRFDPSAGAPQRVPIQVTGDFLDTIPHFKNVKEDISDMGISPTGKRALLEARGDVFTVPAEHGAVRNLTRTPGVRERDPAWSPDGRWIAYLSDRSGEYEIYLRSQDGSGEERQITSGGDAWRFSPLWSPDSSKLAFGDKKQRLRYVEVESGKIVDVDRGRFNDIFHYRWSPDSRWLVYNKAGANRFSSIYVHSLEKGESHQLTGDFTNDYSPVFDTKGRYLYFLSDRDYNLTFSGYEFNYFYTNPTRVYAATLKRDGPVLLLPKNDEEEPAPGEEKPAEKPKEESESEEKKEDSGQQVEIDVEGFANRVVALPAPSGNYGALSANDDGLFFLKDADGANHLKVFLIKSEEVKDVLKDISQYVLSHNGKKILYRQRRNFGIVDAQPEQKTGDTLKLDDLETRIDPKAEWRQIFVDGWRILRDWFYDPGMHGLDWPAMRELYEPLVEHVAHRADLDYILGELGGELSAGHVYVNWGDMPRPPRMNNGLLGAEIEPHESGYYRIAKIFPGENWHDDFRSPLTVAGVNVQEGDFILAVNGRSVREVDNFYALLENAAGKQVALTVNDRPVEEGSHEERVRPIARETDLRYLDWVQSRREMVDRLSQGRIGYIHLPNTSTDGNRELRKFFYPQTQKDALIVDVRYNGGGFIPDRMVELLSRTRLSLWARRGVEPMLTPGFAHVGPKVCLINGYSSSGGDAFPYYFRELGLGPLIGARTWGGLIGLSGNPGFMDGGSIAVPAFRFIDTEGNWAVEGVGVAPDIEVIDRPDLVAKGQDPTLEKAVEVLLKELRENPPHRIEAPVPPRIER